MTQLPNPNDPVQRAAMMAQMQARQAQQQQMSRNAALYTSIVRELVVHRIKHIDPSEQLLSKAREEIIRQCEMSVADAKLIVKVCFGIEIQTREPERGMVE